MRRLLGTGDEGSRYSRACAKGRLTARRTFLSGLQTPLRNVAVSLAVAAALTLAPVGAWADEQGDQSVQVRSTVSASASASSASASAESAAAASELPDYASWSLDDLKKEVENMTAERDAVAARKTDCENQLNDVRNQLSVINIKLPLAQKRADQSVVERYKKLRHNADLVETLLAATDIETLVTEAKYIESVLNVSLDELRALRQKKLSLDLRKTALEKQHEAISANLDQASAKLEAATAARDEAQRKADLVANTHLVPDGADWGAGEAKFVETWAPRIDAYLAGSPLAGQGATFARAAWANHIDPRWSPAISNTESSKGAYCIRPHNAWGWGAADSDPYNLASEWASWEDAIFAHTGGLARGYGYTISAEGAQMYCPSSWEEWYANTVAQMNSI